MSEPWTGEVERARTVPVRPCAPWCTQGEAVHAAEHPEDRHCWSDHVELPRSLSTPERITLPGDTEPTWVHDYVGVYARRKISGQQEVVLYLPEEDADPHFTAGEARAIAAQLLAHADLIDASEVGR